MPQWIIATPISCRLYKQMVKRKLNFMFEINNEIQS